MLLTFNISPSRSFSLRLSECWDALCETPNNISVSLCALLLLRTRIYSNDASSASAALSSCLSTRAAADGERAHCKTHRDVCHLLVLLTLSKEPSTFNFFASAFTPSFWSASACKRDEKNCVRSPPARFLFASAFFPGSLSVFIYVLEITRKRTPKLYSLSLREQVLLYYSWETHAHTEHRLLLPLSTARSLFMRASFYRSLDNDWLISLLRALKVLVQIIKST